MRVADVDSIGVRIGGRQLSNLRYADDTGLCAHPSLDLSTLTNAVNDAGREKGLSLNLSITKIIHIGTCTAGANDTASNATCGRWRTNCRGEQFQVSGILEDYKR